MNVPILDSTTTSREGGNDAGQHSDLLMRLQLVRHRHGDGEDERRDAETRAFVANVIVLQRRFA